MHRRSSSQLKASSQNMSGEPAGSTSKVRKLFPASCCWSIASQHDVDNKKEGNSTGSQDLTKSCGEKSMRRERKRDPTGCLVDEYSIIYGREKDKTAIIGLLLDCEASNRDGVCVISINGKGGVGKTTAAQLVYHDAKVVDFFELRLWIFVPEDFDVLSTTRLILQAVTKENCEFKDDLNLLQLELKENISGKRCLIILDDVLDVDSEQWDLLRKPFAAAHGVKVVVTTRNDGVQSIMGAVSHYHLEGLSDDDCLSVLAHHALGKAKFDAHPELQAIGAKIASQCKGLPLAAKLFGGKLSSTKNYDEWKKISNCEIWDLHEERNGRFPPPRWRNNIVFYGGRLICTICSCTFSPEELRLVDPNSNGCNISNKLLKCKQFTAGESTAQACLNRN